MLKEVELVQKSLDRYKPKFISQNDLNAIKKAASFLAGKKIVHVNATAKGGGVAEILRSLVPLQQSAGVDAQWHVVKAQKHFFEITKEIHNGLQGKDYKISRDDAELYFKMNREFADDIKALDADLYVIHDPQPMGVVLNLEGRPMVARVHVDFSSPNEKILAFVAPMFEKYDKVIVSLREYMNPFIPKKKYAVIPPAIDPLHPKNMPISRDQARNLLFSFGISPKKPIMAQVSRFDVWKNPLGVIEGYYMAKKTIPDLQLLLVGVSLADDDPESKKVFQEVLRYTKGDNDIFTFYEPQKLKEISNDALVNAVHCGADVIIQNSIREGFGLTVTEAMWKENAVVGGPAPGIKKQIKNGKNGFLAGNPARMAKAIVKILKNKTLKKKLGKAGHKSVKKDYLITRLLLDHLRLYKEALKK